MRRAIALILLVVTSLPACYKWTAPEHPVRPTLAADTVRAVRFATEDRILTVKRAHVAGDSLRGDFYDARSAYLPDKRGHPLAEIDTWERQEQNDERTLQATFGVLGLIGTVVFYIAWCSEGWC